MYKPPSQRAEDRVRDSGFHSSRFQLDTGKGFDIEVGSRMSVGDPPDFPLFLEQFMVFVVLKTNVEDSAEKRY